MQGLLSILYYVRQHGGMEDIRIKLTGICDVLLPKEVGILFDVLRIVRIKYVCVGPKVLEMATGLIAFD